MDFMMKFSKLTSYKLLVLFTAGLTIFPAFSDNLLQVYQHALKNDAQIKASEAGYFAALEKRPQALSALKPRIDLGGSATYNLQQTGRTGLRDGGGAFLNLGYNLNLTQPLIHKEIQAQIGQVDASILQAKAGLEFDRQNLILRVSDAYFQSLKAKEALTFATAEKSAIWRQLNQVRAYFDAGRSAITDVKEAQARYDQAIALEVVALQQIDITKESLRAITTRYYSHLAGTSSQTPLLIPKPNDIGQWTQSAIRNSLQVTMASHAVTVAQKAVEIERAAKSPTLDLFAKHSGNTTHGESLFDQDKFDATVGIQFNLPLYRGGNISSRIREARHKLHQTQQQLEAQKRVAAQQTRAAYTTIISGLAQVKAFRQVLNSTQTAANATQAGFEAGTRTAVDVLLALRETFRAKRDYSNSRYDFLLNTLKLKQAAGVLSVSDITALSRLLR